MGFCSYCKLRNTLRKAFILYFVDIKLSYNYNIPMNELLFEWDQNKNILNQKKHNISFEEARTIFLDDNALLIVDPDHSQEEDRFILLGFSLRAKLLVVCHCYRRSENVIRLISARKATKSEASAYTKNREWGD